MVQTEPQQHPHLASGPPSHERFPLLDGYRAIAATMVVATHVGFQTGAAIHGPWSGLLARLDSGVAVFFLLSGFLLFRPISAAHLAGRSGPAVRP
jgi:peptidoglycan/LPS O-acetylase OafA/YrhL